MKLIGTSRQQGFTLVELIMVIVIMGIVGGVVAVFMKTPIDAYFSSARRAALSDVADTTVRRIARDVRKALPNSLRNPASQCIEFIPTKTGGRYRTQDLIAGDGTSLDFTKADSSFNMLGDNGALPIGQQIAQNDIVAIYNLGIPGADAYSNSNTALVTAAPTVQGTPSETTLNISATQFPFASPSNRFQVIPGSEQVVGYACSGVGISASGQGTGTLSRYIAVIPGVASASCPAPPAVGVSVQQVSTIANNVSSCNFSYSGSDLQRNGLLTMTLQISVASETVSLQHEVHVSNTP